MRHFNESRPWHGTEERLCGFSKDAGNLVRAGHARGKARKRSDDFKLVRSFMQSAARFA